ncbi:alanine racemase [Corynebacterium doosanense]|uniref:Alanine racemase n=1 Tax=Corynebacterium doosanense CAU 212 = DSM 45436 TaxID=558173 RepID=A0A097IE10_9CORY|nr:alanine racemase [Corynebacterium doosanense]AIT60350.1 alanine racemase [Corynebacterium doosanense CAU 212 = DSM 45436]
MSQLRARIDLDAIAHNTRAVKARLSEGTRLMAVVKADGYNHGAAEVAAVMAENGADAFGVATAAEGSRLRESGVDKPILAWLWSPDDPGDEVTEALASGVELGVPSLVHLRALVAMEIPARICLKLETGMHRSGIDEAAWYEAFSLARDTPFLTVTGIFSHLARADEPDDPANDLQAANFARAIEIGRSLGLELPVNHLCNSPATLSRPDLHHDQVRVGLALYGMNPLPGEYDLRPAMTWAADVVSVKPLAPGDGVSYGHTFTADRQGYTAVLPVGYADGLPRAMQDKLQVTIAGRRYQQIGRVCMDQIVVDLGDNPHAVMPGAEAVLFGPGAMSVDEFADALGTINYEVACLPKGRTRRQYR